MEKFKEIYYKHKEIANYLIFGVATTIVNWAAYSILVRGVGLSEAVANAIAVVVAVLFAFVTNKIWVFESKQRDMGSLIKEAFSFFGSRAVTGAIEIIGVPALMAMGLNQSIFGVSGMWAKMAISVIVIVLNYIFSKFIVFKSRTLSGDERMKLSFIGCGNMGTAMLKGILAKGLVDKCDIMISESTPDLLKGVCDDLGVLGTLDNSQAAKHGDVIVLAVKPQGYEAVIKGIKDDVNDEQIIVTIAAGKTMAWIEEVFGKSVKVIRTMPNTPALVQEGMTGVCANEKVSSEELEKVITLLEGFGNVGVVPENLIDVVTAVSGSSPAYVFMMIEAMTKAASAMGMEKEQAKNFAAQAVLGSAKMGLETDTSPEELRERVCSPGGTTIEAVRVLEEKEMPKNIAEAMKACVDKAKKL